jgi:hypothetical protein
MVTSARKGPRKRLHVLSGLAVSAVKSCDLKGAFMCAPTVQQTFVAEACDGLIDYGVSLRRPSTAQVVVVSGLLSPALAVAETGSVGVVLLDREVERSLHHHGKRTDGCRAADHAGPWG